MSNDQIADALKVPQNLKLIQRLGELGHPALVLCNVDDTFATVRSHGMRMIGSGRTIDMALQNALWNVSHKLDGGVRSDEHPQ